ncbi:MAG TPA: methionyl-tRNA formyltransferase [Patescibacteria group bacterium]
MNYNFPTIFFGASEYVLPIIEFLNKDYDLKLVITTEKNPTDAVPKYCIENNISYVSIKNFRDENWNIDWKLKIENWKLKFAILADFSLLISQNLIDLFPKGIINIHPSLLPQYRGPTPGLSAILNGEKTTGISIMLLDKELDHGPLIGQITSEIKPDDTSATLYPRLFKEGTDLLKKVLPEYLEGKINPTPQDHSKATYTLPHLTKQTGFIDFDELLTTNPELFERKVRAYFPWPTVWTRYTSEGKLKGKIIKFLPEDKIQVEGKKPQSYNDFLNGYPEEKDFIEKLIEE